MFPDEGFQTHYPARGRKHKNCIHQLNSAVQVPNPLPRKGTETFDIAIWLLVAVAAFHLVPNPLPRKGTETVESVLTV